MHIHITGVAGAIGSHVAEAFLRQGHTVTGIDVLDPYYDPRIKALTLEDVTALGATVHIADLATHDLRNVIPDDTEYIFHFAAQPGISAGTPFAHYVKNNVLATERLLARATTLSGLKLFVYISTSSVYGKNAIGDEEAVPRPTSGYGVTKLAGEQLALSYARTGMLPVTALRLFSVYGPRERPEKLYHKLIHSMAQGEAFPLYADALKHVRSFTFVDDIVRAMEAVLQSSQRVQGEIINIGSTETHTTKEGVEIIEKLFGKPALLTPMPPRQGDQAETQAVIHKAERLLGFTPTVSLQEGLSQQFSWYHEHLRKRL